MRMPPRDHSHIGLAVAIEVPNPHGFRLRSRVVGDGGLENAIAFTQQHTYSVLVCNGQVELSVAPEFAHCH